MQEELTRFLEKQRIQNAMQIYARGVDRREWDLVEQAYHPDAFDDHGGYQGGVPGLMEWLKRRHADIEQSMHFLGNCLVDFLSDTTAVAETYCIVYQRYGEEARETIQTWLGNEALPRDKKLMAELFCRYVDRFEKRDGEWRIARRTVVMEEVKVSAEKVRLNSAHATAMRDRTDPLWRALSSKS